MHVEISVWRPLVELAVILVLLGLPGTLHSRDRQSWWLSHGLMILGLLTGLVAAARLHPDSPLLPLVGWIVPVLLIEGLALWQGSRLRSQPGDERS